MIKPGYIEITDKVRFVYHEKEKPNKDEFWNTLFSLRKIFLKVCYSIAMKEYEASKQTIEVSNDSYANCFNLDDDGKIDSFWIIIKGTKNLLQNNQPCKAEVNGKATIIELIK